MPETNKRIIVEGVNFGLLFQFHRILRAATASLQPARLVVALLMVTALITFGRIWDGVVEPNAVSPHGLMDGRWQTDVHHRTHQNALHMAISRHTGVAADRATDLHARDVIRSMRAEYRDRRAAFTTDEERTRFDEQFTQTLRFIDESRPQGIFESSQSHAVASVRMIVSSVLAADFASMLEGLHRLFIAMPRILWENYTLFTIIFGLLTMIVLAIGGGAIARMTAVQMAVQQRTGVRTAVDFSLRRIGALFTAQALPLIVLLVMCGAVVVMGVLMAAPVLDVLGGLLYGLALVLGFLIAFLIIGYVLGHPLLVPAVACENCGGPDAMQRAYAYVVTRPLHLLGYWLIALIGLALGLLLVNLFAVLMLNSTATLYGWLNDNPALSVAGGHELFNLTRPDANQLPGTWHHSTAAAFIGFWETIVVCIVAAYVFSYFYTAATIVYMLMRRAADGQDIEEIWQQSEMAMTAPPSVPATPAVVST